MTDRPILVGYDASEGARLALAWALDEAARTGTSVLLAYAFEWMTAATWIGPGPGPGTWPDETTRRAVGEMVSAAVTEATDAHPGLTVRGEVLDTPAGIGLAQRSADAALVVLGSRGHGGFSGLLAGSTTISVSAHAHCPVVVVRPLPDAGPGAEPGRRRIVAGADGSPYARLALAWAVERAVSRAAPLHAIRAWAEPRAPWRPADLDPAEVTRTELNALDEELAGWRDRYPDLPITGEVVTGHPTEVLVEASRQAQLVVVGTRGHGGFRGLVLGSVSQQLLHHAESPVAVIRELPPDTAR
ncbi:universal stress protein [Micromonospora sp. NBC_01796]|uniref:universal stress protein n=1 Tax=Micromonospora sp. NBC_01796 TaxID=2975987 RepID=UPI002DD8F9A1|nr:universal stress protein [Micromonospora sp. NBC_01796]WSA86562.1 universal stress protein [Micromonospora sp. NBC_01796]